jgi:hypothetical protein
LRAYFVRAFLEVWKVIQKTARAERFVQKDPLFVCWIYARFERSLYLHGLRFSYPYLFVNQWFSKLSFAVATPYIPGLQELCYGKNDRNDII